VDKVGKLIGRVIAAQPKSRQISELRLRLALVEILGPALGDACEEVHLRGGTLSVAVSNPALAHQLRLDAGTLVERLNERRVARRVTELRVRTGRAARSE
jgi:Dna[CI] antecedent, DciA